MTNATDAKAFANATERRAREAAGLALTVERKRTDRYRIEERTVFIVCQEREMATADTFPDLFGRVRLAGDSWTRNHEETLACDTLEGAQAAMKRMAEREW